MIDSVTYLRLYERDGVNKLSINKLTNKALKNYFKENESFLLVFLSCNLC